MKKIIELKLKILAKLILKKYQPKIIGITGSVGKTSTKEAIYCVLKNKYRCRRSQKNYNNEIGLPLSIIGVMSPGKNIFGWLMLGLRAMFLLLKKDKTYPEVLILEMGVDHPGDMDYLNSIVTCDLGIATMVGSVHVEHFASRDKLQEEKTKLIKSVSKKGTSIINYDNEGTLKMAGESRARVLTYGLKKGADIKAKGLSFNYDLLDNNNLQGIGFEVQYRDKVIEISLPNVLGIAPVYSSLAALGVAIVEGISLGEASEALKKLKSPLGRMNLVKGIKKTLLLDDTYNSEPKSATLAVELLKQLPTISAGKRIAVLGDMLELGKYSVSEHKKIGELLAKNAIDTLFTVGERARDIARGAISAGMKEGQVFNFDQGEQAGKFLQKRIKKNDIILFKGSQSMRMEKIVLELMAEPLRAKELLVRQGKGWK